jgi:hypothetical protein
MGTLAKMSQRIEARLIREVRYEPRVLRPSEQLRI